MKRLLSLLTAAVLCCSKVNAQSPNVFFEIGGPGLASFNYDMRFTKSPGGFGGRIGVGGFNLEEFGGTAIYLPMAFNYLSGKNGRHFLELGAGFTPLFYSGNSHTSIFAHSFAHINIGYRFQPANSGFVFRLGATPMFSNHQFIPMGGISFGYKFK